jgi:beta-mannosidase
VKTHQKHPTGYETIQSYLENYYLVPTDFENYIYVSQLLQAEGMKMSIESHRRAKPYCMGTLYWQFNDCWPVTSWSSRDYFGAPKALDYFARKAFGKYSVSADSKDGFLRITIVSDDTAKTEVQLKYVLSDFDGNVLRADSGKVSVGNERSETVFNAPYKKFVSNTYYANAFLKMELTGNGKLLAENVYYFNTPKGLLLKKTDIKYSLVEIGNNEFRLTLSSEWLAKNVFVDFGDSHVSFSDNYFDLLPKENKVVRITSDASLQELKESIRLKSLVDTYSKD